MTNREKFNKMTDHEVAEYIRNNLLWICTLCMYNEHCDDNPAKDSVLTIEKWLGEEAKDVH